MKKFLIAVCIVLLAGPALAATLAGTEVSFSWRDTNPPEAQIAGYRIYRSFTGTKPWNPVNKELYTEQHATVKIDPDDERECWFYCVAVNKKGDMSLPSDIVHMLPPVTDFKYTITITFTNGGGE